MGAMKNAAIAATSAGIAAYNASPKVAEIKQAVTRMIPDGTGTYLKQTAKEVVNSPQVQDAVHHAVNQGGKAAAVAAGVVLGAHALRHVMNRHQWK